MLHPNKQLIRGLFSVVPLEKANQPLPVGYNRDWGHGITFFTTPERAIAAASKIAGPRGEIAVVRASRAELHHKPLIDMDSLNKFLDFKAAQWQENDFITRATSPLSGWPDATKSRELRELQQLGLGYNTWLQKNGYSRNHQAQWARVSLPVEPSDRYLTFYKRMKALTSGAVETPFKQYVRETASGIVIQNRTNTRASTLSGQDRLVSAPDRLYLFRQNPSDDPPLHPTQKLHVINDAEGKIDREKTQLRGWQKLPRH